MWFVNIQCSKEGSLFGWSFNTITVYDHYLDFFCLTCLFYFFAGVEVEKRLLGKSLSSLQLVRIE